MRSESKKSAHGKGRHARNAPITSPLAICPSCGVIALEGHRSCAACKAEFASPLVVHDPSNGFWVAVECEFTCSACGQQSPLNYLATGGDVQCLRCGVELRFERGQWWSALEHAHTTGDLAGPLPEGRFATPGAGAAYGKNDYKTVGVSRAYIDHRAGPNHLFTRAAPGHPLCANCKRPLNVTSSGTEGLSTVCPSCGDAHACSRPANIPAHLADLGGVLDSEHLVGGQPAALKEDAAGAVSIRCPNCAAELEFDRRAVIVNCRYCRTMVRLPTRKLRSMGDSSPARVRWWLYFTDVSQARKKFEKVQSEPAQGAKLQQESPSSKPDSTLGQILWAAVTIAVIVLICLFAWWVSYRNYHGRYTGCVFEVAAARVA